MRSSAVPDIAPHGALAALARLVLDYRLLTLVIAAGGLSLLHQGGGDVSLLLLALGVLNALPLLRWNRVAPFLMRHPMVLTVDSVITLMVLLVTGVDGPLLSYTFGTAFLAGLLYGRLGSGVFAALLVVGYLSVIQFGAVSSGSASFRSLVGTPSLYVLLAIGAAEVRSLLIRQARIEAELVTARGEAAAAGERARLARELHDSLGKTLHGITLLATTLPRWVERDPARAAKEARTLAGSAQGAADEARELLRGMRADRLDLPLPEAVGGFVHAWSQDSSLPVALEVEPVTRLEPDARYELFWILREALRNVERHARAESVRVELAECGADAVLRVSDDGVGLSEDVGSLATRGHFGVLGMSERARRVGGHLTVERGPCRGTVVTATVPLSVPDGKRSLVDARGAS